MDSLRQNTVGGYYSGSITHSPKLSSPDLSPEAKRSDIKLAL
jgi:hypothetical protein